MKTYVKKHRAANNEDYESWEEGEVTPTLSLFDSGDVRATTLIVDDEKPVGFNWANGGGYGAAHDGLAITEDGVGPLSVSQVPAVARNLSVRRLTPLECERLMGWPDGHTAGQSDTQRYKQAGNGIVAPVAQFVAELIIDANSRMVGE